MNAPRPDGIVWRKSSYSAHNGGCVEVGWAKSSYSANNGACVEVGWAKSSHSVDNGGCVEVGWAKSSHSSSNGDCVEVSGTAGDRRVRDSKARSGPELAFSGASWQAFLTRVAGADRRR